MIWRHMIWLALLALALNACDVPPDQGAATDWSLHAATASQTQHPIVIAPDSDRDGITDFRELREGTDPLDPGDASAWHPKWSGHPRLVTDQAGWLAVKDRVLAGDPEATRLFSRVAGYARRDPIIQDPDAYDFSYDETNGYTASAAALSALVNDDAAAAAKAVEITASLYFDIWMWSLGEWDQGTIHGSTALIHHCLAYDLLVGFDLIDAEDADRMRNAILDYVAILYDMYVTIPIAMFTPNNHVIKLTSGLAVTGMTFNDVPESAKYVNLGLSTVPWVLFEFQMPPGGGQAEGPSYLDYTIVTFLPFAVIYHNVAQGEALPYRTVCRARLQVPCFPTVQEVADPLTDPRLQQILDWRFAVNMPGGKNAPLDDSNLGCGYSSALARFANRPDFAWHVEQSGDCTDTVSALAIFELPFLDALPASELPPYHSVAMPEAGQNILRSGWDGDAFFGLLNGEHGIARLSGIGHEQADATSFMLHALGEYFVIDSGYIGWSDRSRVCFADNHNLILADGAGPFNGLFYLLADTDAYLTDFVDEPPFRATRVESSYALTDVERWLLLIGEEYFVISDRIASFYTRDYTWQAHTLAGGDTDGVFTLTGDGAVVDRPQALMNIHVQARPEAALTEAENEHGYAHYEYHTHSVLQAHTQTDAANFLAVFAPGTDELAPPTVTAGGDDTRLAYTIAGLDFLDAVIAAEQTPYTLAIEGFGTISSDAALAWIRIDPASGTVTGSNWVDGSYLDYSP